MMRPQNCRLVSQIAGFVVSLILFTSAIAQIPRPQDAPNPLPPDESAKCARLPPGFRLELISAEPLVREPSGVCWDERGRLFVCELHGYNLEGQHDIEELNKTGQLDRVVRRIQANERAKQAAKKQTYGTVKRLIDSDGDGRMDKAAVWADRLPPCFGICPARGGLIVVCSPDIMFLADRDGDDNAEVREKLFTGFTTGILERRMSAPQWGIDNWIYVGRGGGGRITGPNLKEPVSLPNSDFRIQADGSEIEPVGGATHTVGHAFTELGERFVVGTRSPGIFVAPLPWRYLARNPNVASPRLEYDASPDQRVYPISKPHPWRTKRADDPGFSKYYRDRYGIQESTPNGYFTSACSPLVYQDAALPGLRGHLLACEPAQTMVYRAVVYRDGLLLKLRRPAGEERREFLASSDPWFHPIALAHAPNGSIAIVDFYREIIEDYSAIPRYLQQQYGLVNGQNHGRIWRLTHRDAPKAQPAGMSRLTAKQLAAEIASDHFWRRQTARRLLIERNETAAAAALHQLARDHKQPSAVLGALYTLAALGKLTSADVSTAMSHQSAGVRVHALRLSERWLDRDESLLKQAIATKGDPATTVLLQLALTMGESRDPRAVSTLANLAEKQSAVRWMPDAILSSISGREVDMLAEFLKRPTNSPATMLQPLCAAISARRAAAEISRALALLADSGDHQTQLACLRALQAGFKNPVAIRLNESGRTALNKLASHDAADIRSVARLLTVGMKVEDPAQRKARLARAVRDLRDIQLPSVRRVAAVEELAAEEDAKFTGALLAAFSNSTPKVREAILAAVFSRSSRLPAVVGAIEQKKLPVSALSAVRRSTLTEHPMPNIRGRAAKLFGSLDHVSDETFRRFAAALKAAREPAHGEKIFREKCANCHQAHGIGVAVGPDLTAEFRRAEETIVKDILAPSAEIAAGHATYAIQTTDGRVVNGLLAVESPGSITLRAADGKQQTVLRKNIEVMKAVNVSLMPEELAKTLKPKDVADVIAWLRRPAERRVLFDDDPAFIHLLNEGKGTATLAGDDRHSGQVSLRITPPQKYSPRIAGWQFRIREKPAPGEFRYVRFAWKSAGANGVMIELANDGKWPPAKSPHFRYYSGQNTTGWAAVEVSVEPPNQWTVVVRDLWEDFGNSTITGIAPTAIGGPALFDRIELLRSQPNRH